MSDEQFLVRNVFDNALVHRMASDFKAVQPDFDIEIFLLIVGNFEDQLSFKARSKKIETGLQKCLSDDFLESFKVLKAVVQNFKPVSNWGSFYLLPIGDYVAANGCSSDYLKYSFELLALITKKFTSEFAIRTFIASYPDETIAFLKRCAVSEDEHLRRLASEGSRPSLPWAKKVNWLNDNPTKVLALLAKIDFENSKYVQKSVANHLNDWTKSSANLVYEFIDKMPVRTEATNWVIKHALRNEFKRGDERALNLFGFFAPNIHLLAFSTSKNNVNVGDSVVLNAKIKNTSKADQKLMIDYKCFFKKANGSNAPKVFKWKQVVLKAGEIVELTHKQNFRLLTTRKYHSGVHYFKLVVNGKEFGRAEVNLNIF